MGDVGGEGDKGGGDSFSTLLHRVEMKIIHEQSQKKLNHRVFRNSSSDEQVTGNSDSFRKKKIQAFFVPFTSKT